MSECVILIASAKIPAGKRCNFSWPKIRLSVLSHHLIHQQFKHCQRTKINKTMLSTPPPPPPLSVLKSK